KSTKKASPVLDKEDKTKLAKAIRAASLALGFNGVEAFSFYTRQKFESSPYNFKEIQQAIDTDSYAKQAFAKHRELFWKAGWDLVSENPDTVDYLWERIDYLEIAMKQPF